MSKNVFGWNYPAGAENDPRAPWNQVDPPCEVCGKDPLDCICPECPTCVEQGNPSCYNEFDGEPRSHGMVRTQEQIDSLAALERRIDDDRVAEEAAYEEELGREIDYGIGWGEIR